MILSLLEKILPLINKSFQIIVFVRNMSLKCFDDKQTPKSHQLTHTHFLSFILRINNNTFRIYRVIPYYCSISQIMQRDAQCHIPWNDRQLQVLQELQIDASLWKPLWQVSCSAVQCISNFALSASLSLIVQRFCFRKVWHNSEK